ncbi:GPI-anchored wall transfer protein, putative [Pediculus humanus corporis]|uniref:GPI-anchored wall transfer protein, putative n=1 Tax=Pediculus humanus subsp. corporis TaxID=121224 RepID=E0VEQ9_PEDHC|nr:GPI-anchored wall transfer protein, putative [Pediculus humanus corporis]EEB11865.1 GPI-anchored wall transfer protein, putative [Pediculus humanus corporis]
MDFKTYKSYHEDFMKFNNGTSLQECGVLLSLIPLASTNFISAICILAVDFHVFPRRFAKTELYGCGLMDLGVGFFICANGLVHNRKSHQTKTNVLKNFLNCGVLFMFGFIRLISTKTIEYQEHLTEYGTQWNFFFTLGCCKMFIYLAELLFQNKNFLWLCIVTGIIHEAILSLGIREWIFSNEPRNTFLSANREGLFSCLGYLCIYFAATCLGKFLTFSSSMKYQNVITFFVSLSFFGWVTVIFFNHNFGISRRLANSGYIIWVLSLTVNILLLLTIIELSLIILKNEKPGLINVVFQTFLLNEIWKVMRHLKKSINFGYT